MAIMLRALIAKIISTPDSNGNSASLKELMFNATRQAFVSDTDVLLNPDV